MAGYRDIYTKPFVSELGENWSVAVMRRDWKKLASSVNAGIDPFGIDYPDVTDTEGIKDIFDPIRGSAYALEFVAEDKFSLKGDLYTEDARKFLVSERKNGTENYKGFLNPDLSEEPYGHKPVYIKAGATCGLKGLENRKFANAEGNGFYVAMSVISILAGCLAQTDLGLEILIACDTYGVGHDQTKDPLSQAYLQPLRFVGDDDEPQDCFAVLKAICKAYGLIVFQQNTQWYLVQPRLFATKEAVKHYRYDATGKLINESLLSPVLVICDHTADTQIKILADNPTSAYIPSLRKVTVETEYGPVANRLVNGRFQQIYNSVQGKARATGWYHYRLDPVFEVPNPQKYWNAHKAVFSGTSKAEDSNVNFRAFPSVGNPLNLAYYQQADAPTNKAFLQSSPIVVRAGDVVSINGSFLNLNCRGAYIQAMAMPLRNLDLVLKLKQDPATPIYAGDVLPILSMFMDESSQWQRVNTAGIPIENTSEESVNGKLVVKATGENKAIDLESNKIPFQKWDLDISSGNGKYRFTKDSNIVYYLVYLFLHRGLPYEDNKPAVVGNPTLTYESLNVGVRRGLDLEDIRSERIMLEQTKNVGREWKDIKLSIGSVGGEQYYCQILNADSTPVTHFTRRGKGESYTLAHLTAMGWLSQYRKSTMLYKLTLKGKSFEYGSTFMMEDGSGPFHVIGARLNRRSGASQVTLAELLSGIVKHTYTRWDVNANGKAMVKDSGTVEGDIVENEGDLFFTFFEPNGLNDNKLGFTGSVWSSYPNGIFYYKAHDFTVAWNDANDDGPYQVIVESPFQGQGIHEYQKVYQVGKMYTTVEVPECPIRIKVKTASGVEISREANITAKQLLQLRDAGRSCVGDFPAVTAVLGNGKTPTMVKIPLSNRMQNLSPALYYAEVVNLGTGETVFANAKGSVVPFVNTLGIVVQLPEEWNSGLYGFRIIDGLFGDRCGIITQITRCKDMEPILFNEAFEEGFYIEEVPG